ncbi:MAG: protein kinase [Rhodothermales bacterium]
MSLPVEQRLRYVDEVCGDDDSLRERLLRLVQSSEEAEQEQFFDKLGQEVPNALRPTEPFRSGDRVGQYVIEDLIGRGGMGVVYRAKDLTLQRTVALKFLNGPMLVIDEARQRFLNEARAAAALDHPNICTVYEIGESDGAPFIAMALVQGKSLKRLQQERTLDLPEALRLAMQVCDGLVAAHERGVVHRDIKPANLMISDHGRLVITDFGLAKMPGAEDLSKSGTTRGTVAYMSPEQARGRDVDPRTDLWSFGVVMYEMIAGARPFEEKNEYDTIQAIINDPPKPLERLRPEAPRELRELIYRLLAKKPRDRYPSAQDVLVDLRSIDSSLRLRKEITRSAKQLPSIAVMPFVNMSTDPEDEFFCEGLGDELINGLCSLSGLRVASRTSSYSFKGRGLEVKEIGQRLNVGHILEGSVRKMGMRVRLIVQLSAVEDGYHLWSSRYDRVMEDVFDVQDELVKSIIEVLKVKLLDTEIERLTGGTSTDPEAYEAYLKARFYWNRRTKQDLEAAISLSERVLEIDPAYAGAYSCLSDSLIFCGLHGYLPGHQVYPRAKAAAEKAIEYAPELAEAYSSLGLARVFCDWDWQGAERASRKALLLSPNSSSGHSLYAGFVLGASGRMEEAINEISIAQHKDPLSFVIHTVAGVIHWQAHLYEKSFEWANRALELNPRYWLAHALQGLVYEQWEQYREAIASFQKSIELTGTRTSTLGLGMLGHAYALAGEADRARVILAEIGAPRDDRYVSPFDCALVHAGLAEIDDAFLWLDRAVTECSSWTVLAAVDPRFAELRRDPRFGDITRRMKLSAWRLSAG